MKDTKEKIYPKKGAGRRLAARLKELGQKPPLKELTEAILRHAEEERARKKKVASARPPVEDAGVE